MTIEVIPGIQTEVEIRLKRVKNCSIRVQSMDKTLPSTSDYLINARNKKIILTLNRRLSEYEIRSILKDKMKFLIKCFTKTIDKPNKENQLNENEYLLLGKVYKIDLNPMNEFLIEGNTIHAKTIQEIENYGMNQMKLLFENIMNNNNFPKTTLYIHSMKSRWGVCYPTKNKIGLTKALIHVPFDLIEYVIYHEFTHYYHLDHSKRFHKTLENYIPNEKERRKKLRGYSDFLYA